MTSDVSTFSRAAALTLAMIGLSGLGARAAEPSYPFEGSWVRVNRSCTANAPHAKTYTAREVTSSTAHCGIRKVAAGSGQFEIFEDCRRGERPGNFTETIRMLGPDLMVVRRQAARLKIARPLRFTRCTIAAPNVPRPAVAPPRHPAAPTESPGRQGEERGARPGGIEAMMWTPPVRKTHWQARRRCAGQSRLSWRQRLSSSSWVS